MRRLLPLVLAIFLAACNSTSKPTPTASPEVSGFDPSRYTIGHFDPLNPGRVWQGGIRPQGEPSPLTDCQYQISNPHQSSYKPTEVKTDARVTCRNSTNPYTLALSMTLQRNDGGTWSTVSTGSVISRAIAPGVATIWFQNELLAVSKCEDGVYRGVELCCVWPHWAITGCGPGSRQLPASPM